MQRLHRDEVPIDSTLVTRLLSQQRPELAAEPLRRVAALGTENVVFRLGEHLSVRLPRKRSAVGGLLREIEWLPRLAPHLALPVPEPIWRGEPTVDYPFPWAVCRWVPGGPADGARRLDAEDTAVRLGHFVRDLHGSDTTGGPVADERSQRAGSLASFDEATRDALERVEALMVVGRIERELFDPGAARELWEAAVAAPRWSGEGVWLHRDLYLGNLLVTDGRLSGVVDFGALLVGDPAGDVMAAWHVLPRHARATFLGIVGADAAMQLRARGWVLSQGLHALPYYLDTHDGMVRMARRAITAALDTPV